jgi:hypothetical protein
VYVVAWVAVVVAWAFAAGAPTANRVTIGPHHPQVPAITRHYPSGLLIWPLLSFMSVGGVPKTKRACTIWLKLGFCCSVARTYDVPESDAAPDLGSGD